MQTHRGLKDWCPMHLFSYMHVPLRNVLLGVVLVATVLPSRTNFPLKA